VKFTGRWDGWGCLIGLPGLFDGDGDEGGVCVTGGRFGTNSLFLVVCTGYPFIAQRFFIFRKMTLIEGLIQNHLVENICFCFVYDSAI